MSTNALAIVPALSSQVQVIGEFETRKVELLSHAKLIATVADEFDQDLAVESIKGLKGLLTAVETSRTTVKAPVLELGKAIDTAAKKFCAEVDAEVNRLNQALRMFQLAERRKAEEAERLRLQELARIEREKQAAAERERKAAEEAARAEAARLKADEDAFADGAEQALAAEQKRKQEAEYKAAVERTRQAELTRQEQLVRSAPVAAPVVAKGMSVRDSWVFDVVSLDALVRAHPGYCRVEPNKSVINAAIANGMRECPGLRIYQETKVRA